jgi:hypothetical protein
MSVFTSGQFNWEAPIFIIGNPRSGTSLLRLILHSHSQICIPPESHFFLWLEEKYSQWEMTLLDAYLIDLFNSTKFETWEISEKKLKAFIIEQNPASYAQLNSLVYYAFNKNPAKKVLFWGDKNKLWKEKLRSIVKHYPKAKFIHLIRDGRDVACSFKEIAHKNLQTKYAPKLPTEISSIANRWVENVNFIERFLSELNPTNTFSIQYENLLRNMQTELTPIAAFIGIELEPQMFEYYNQSKESIEPAAFFQWKEKLQSPPDVDNISKFRHQLTLEEIATFNRIAQRELQFYNYTL